MRKMTKTSIVLSSSLKRKPKRGKKGRKLAVAKNGVLERETSLYIYGRSDRQNLSGQEGKSLYAERPTRGFRF